jgi:CRISPR-associated endonuclease/helicase Cas3
LPSVVSPAAAFVAGSLDVTSGFATDFEALSGFAPMRWQTRLFDDFVAARFPPALDLPTGLGKTSVMTIWYLARKAGAPLPRRLVYVVDRRAVVDQATTSAEKLFHVSRNDKLRVSTLRGQHVDNRAWLADPSSPAIIVGTIDMVGSRLLFSGYGVSPKMRPYHAGLLGADTLFVLDEAHLCPPFEALLEAIQSEREASLGPSDKDLGGLIPPFRLISLSATGRNDRHAKPPFSLEGGDREDAIVRKRLDAEKRLQIIEDVEAKALPYRLAQEALTLAASSHQARILIYCDKRDDAESIKMKLDEKLYGKGAASKTAADSRDTQLLVGARRVLEREELSKWLETSGFLSESAVPDRPKYLVATSAGEVGVDLDATHMVCDVVEWERMVQRFGRVNRLGKGKATVTVLAVIDKSEERAARQNAAIEVLRHLPTVGENEVSASPGAIVALNERAGAEAGLAALIAAATSPEPLRPGLTRPLVEAWSMTALDTHTGRPEVQPWLRGWIEEEPQTGILWRTFLPARPKGPEVSNREIEDFFEAASPHTSEVLETETHRVVDWLIARAVAAAADLKKSRKQDARPEDEAGPDDETAIGPTAGTDESDEDDASDDRDAIAEQACLKAESIVAIVLGRRNKVEAKWTLAELAQLKTKDTEKAAPREKRKDRLSDNLRNRTLVIDSRIGGLSEAGMLTKDVQSSPKAADTAEDWLLTDDGKPVVSFRVGLVSGHDPASAPGEAGTTDATEARDHPEVNWRESHRFVVEANQEGEPRKSLVVLKWRHEAQNDNDRSIGREQRLDEHQSWTEVKARALAAALGLRAEYIEMLATAARLHDEGKRAERWQRAVRARRGEPLAKSSKTMNPAMLDGYRHEFGSLPYVECDPGFIDLRDDNLKDLALHLVAAHHGWARPVIPISGCDDDPPSILEERARAVALRFARLQKLWGPWGLAWWEALLRAADAQASADNDDPKKSKEMEEQLSRIMARAVGETA